MKKTTRYSKSRQKACQQCTKAKVRCDQNLDGCSRCRQRGYTCVFTQAQASDALHQKDEANGVNHNNSSTYVDKTSETLSSIGGTSAIPSGDMDYFGFAGDANLPIDAGKASVHKELDTFLLRTAPKLSSIHHTLRQVTSIDFESELVCPINAQEISNRWLNAYIPTIAQTAKTYPPNVASFMHNMLRSYAAVIVHGRGVPPFIHLAQAASLEKNPQLSACLSLARMCDKPALGAESVVVEVLEREMTKVHTEGTSKDGKTLRATFQAYLVYAMVLYFCLNRQSKPSLRQIMVNLQELACTSSQSGLVCSAELRGVRPNWETWIAAESQRRTLYLMYLFDNLLSIRDSLLTFLGTELRGLPAPSSKSLWHASTRQEWEMSYNAHLVAWSSDGLTVDDLWPATEGTDAAGLAIRRERIDRWLEGVDEFGTMLYAVTCCTHGS